MAETSKIRVVSSVIPYEEIYDGDNFSRRLLHSRINKVLGGRRLKTLSSLSEMSWVKQEDVVAEALTVSAIGVQPSSYPPDGDFQNGNMTEWTEWYLGESFIESYRFRAAQNASSVYSMFLANKTPFAITSGQEAIVSMDVDLVPEFPTIAPQGTTKPYFRMYFASDLLKSSPSTRPASPLFPTPIGATVVDNTGFGSLYYPNHFAAYRKDGVSRRVHNVTFTFTEDAPVAYPIFQIYQTNFFSSNYCTMTLDNIDITLPAPPIVISSDKYYDGLDMHSGNSTNVNFVYIEIIKGIGTTTPNVGISLDGINTIAELNGVGDFCVLPTYNINISELLKFKKMLSTSDARLRWIAGRL